MINEIKVAVAGNVTRAPEVKYRKADGKPFVVVAVAVNNRRYDPGQQQWVEDGATFYDIICRNGLGANALASLEIGTPVIAYGKFRLHEWTTDTMRGARPNIVADSIGVDLTWGTASYVKGMRSYPTTGDGYEPSIPPASEGGPEVFEDSDGTTFDANGEVIHAPGDGADRAMDDDRDGETGDTALDDDLDREVVPA